jgi:protease-4
MNYQFLRDILSSPWQIEPSTLNTFYPVFRGILNGLQIEKSKDSVIDVPFFLSANNHTVLSSENNPLTIPQEQPMEKTVHILPLNSLLTKHDQPCGPLGTRSLASMLLAADNNESIIGHILLIESGGGQASAVPELTDAIQKCKKPILAWVDGMAASAAYYIASYCPEIMASRTSDIIGCIGTMIVWEGRKNKSPENSLGDVSVTIYADDASDKNIEYEKAINEFDFTLAKERILNPMNKKFQSDVTANRQAVLHEHLTGRTFQASEVMGSLIDSIGDFQSAVDRLLILANYTPEIPQLQNHKSNNSNKEMKQFRHLNLALDLPALEATDEGVFLNEEQLTLVEERLEANQQLVSERDASRQSLDEAVLSAATAQSAFDSALTAFDQIDPTIASAETPTLKAEAIRTLLSSKVSDAPVGALETQDNILESEVDWDAINNSELGKLANNL